MVKKIDNIVDLRAGSMKEYEISSFYERTFERYFLSMWYDKITLNFSFFFFWPKK